MANEALSASHDAWNTQYGHYLSLSQLLEQTEPRERELLEQARAKAQDDLLDTPAPTLTAVMQKLEILFEGELHGFDQASEARRLILDDLQSLIRV